MQGKFDTGLSESLRKLREPRKQAKLEKYKKHASRVRAAGYPLPTTWFASYGILRFLKDIEDAPSARLLEIFEKGLGVAFTDDEKAEYSKIRELRNKVAHGEQTSVELRAALAASKFLRDLLKRVDKHIITYTLLCEG